VQQAAVQNWLCHRGLKFKTLPTQLRKRWQAESIARTELIPVKTVLSNLAWASHEWLPASFEVTAIISPTRSSLGDYGEEPPILSWLVVVGGIPTPLKNMSSSDWIIIPTNQPVREILPGQIWLVYFLSPLDSLKSFGSVPLSQVQITPVLLFLLCPLPLPSLESCLFLPDTLHPT